MDINETKLETKHECTHLLLEATGMWALPDTFTEKILSRWQNARFGRYPSASHSVYLIGERDAWEKDIKIDDFATSVFRERRLKACK